MAKAAKSELWDHTSALLAMTANVNRNPKDEPVKPHQFHPFYEPPPVDTKAAFAQLKAAFIKP